MKTTLTTLQKWKEQIFSFFVNKIKGNRDLLAYLVFFLIATTLWFLNALQKEYITNISYPIEYSNFPDSYILHSKTHTDLKLKIKGQGYSLLKYQLGTMNTPINLSVSNFKIKEKGNVKIAYVLSRDYLNAVSSRLDNNIQLLEIFPDTLSITLDKKEHKLVNIKYNSTFSYKTGYNKSGDISTEPKQIEISGPASIIDTIKCVKLEAKNYTNLKDSIIEQVKIEKMDKITFNYRKVKLIVPIEAFTEKKISVPIDAINLSDSLQVKTFPSNITISCRIPVSKFAQIDKSLFKAQINYSTYNSTNLPNKLKVKLVHQPKGINNISYSPLFVECLFEKKQ